MKAEEDEMTIIEKVRQWKEQNASECDFDIDRIIASAREREAKSSERLLDPPCPTNGEQVAGHEPPTRRKSNAE